MTSVIIIIAFISAAIIGKTQNKPNLSTFISVIYPKMTDYLYKNSIYSVYSKENLLRWVSIGKSEGYGGEIIVISAISLKGNFNEVRILKHSETPTFFSLLNINEFLNSIKGRHLAEIDFEKHNLLTITEATKSAKAVSEALKESTEKIAKEKFNISFPEKQRKIEFGLLEIAIIILFVTSITAYKTKNNIKNILTKSSRFLGLLIIGFWKNSPLTIAKISAFMSGYFSDIHTNLYWYLLLVGFIITILIFNESLYCNR